MSKRALRIRNDRSKAVLSFKTYAEDGLLFYMGGMDYLSLEIREGKVVFQYDLGGGAALLESQNTYNDGNWHTVVIDRNKRNGILSINNKEEGKLHTSLPTYLLFFKIMYYYLTHPSLWVTTIFLFNVFF